MSGRRVMAAAILLAAATPAAAFVRETTAVGDPAAGHCLWWGTRQLRFKVNATSAAAPPGGRPACAACAPCLDATAAAAAVTAALPVWSGATRAGAGQACTDLDFVGEGATGQVALGNDGTNLVVFRTGWCGSTAVVPLADPCRAAVGACAAKYNCWEHDATGTIGLTTTTFRVATGEILDADVEFHGWDGAAPANGSYLTCADGPGCGAFGEAGCTSTDVASLALHEAGHVLGLDHTCQYAAPYDACPAGSVMEPIIGTGSTRRTLAPDDVEGVCTVYPRGAATLTCAPPEAPKPGGCATGGGAGALALLGAALAARRAGRRRPGEGPRRGVTAS